MYALAPPPRAPTRSPAAAAYSVRPYILHRLHRGTNRRRGAADLRCRRRLLTARGERPSPDDEDEDEQEPAGFDAAVALFNGGEYYACHDVVEELWYSAEDPARTLLHGVLQCAVGFHHLFNQNHRGAMMELGEGLCKLRRVRLEDDDGDDEGPFSRFRDEVAAVLSFLYRTQKELAACTDELCLAMDGSATSYQLLGDFAAGSACTGWEPTPTASRASSSPASRPASRVPRRPPRYSYLRARSNFRRCMPRSSISRRCSARTNTRSESDAAD
ncbi:hypothetical protein ACQ4PT_035535 [Festuca glaucescens]